MEIAERWRSERRASIGNQSANAKGKRLSGHDLPV
jgi:hypothetical protein